MNDIHYVLSAKQHIAAQSTELRQQSLRNQAKLSVRAQAANRDEGSS